MHAALSPTRPVSAEEQQAINDLRTILPSIECLEDSYVLRWLRAKDLRFDETADSLKKHVVFRKAWELDTISSWEAPEADWKWALAQYVNLDGWPVHWGGNRVENGDPKCPATIRYGMGPVPSDYFVDPKRAMPDYDQLTTVYAGDKHLISIRVKERCKICWQYMTDDDDIGFAIHFDPSFQV
ncbi:hypothetical protein TELCIR_09432 [Teladorsagia circumcincta]|uniref:CRAL/TRIO protein n=1 Tax=Teladorsagia circumcincta TaxID=45464 RepID=A0A2G9UEU1_TELCI|nr:hypothetical protein TELCIR_09432 [Teladorsagia circumcincta]